MRIFYWAVSVMFGVILCVRQSVAETIDWVALLAKGDYFRAGFTEMIAQCKNSPDGIYPGVVDKRGFYMCVNGEAYFLYCNMEGTEFIDEEKACNWATDTIPAYMKKCDSVSYNAATFCNCADNPNFSMRGGGNACSCNSSGYGIDYSNCTATPPCPEMKDINGENQATREDGILGRCYVQPGITFSDDSGAFEYPQQCFYTE